MDEIVRRLQKSRASVVSSLKESMLLEKDEEEEKDQEDPAEDEGSGDETPADGEDIVSRMNKRASSAEDTSSEDDEDIPTSDEEADDEQPTDDSGETIYENPLDNPYAVHYTIGDSIRFVYATGSEASIEGVIDGYDTEGFYRVKWESGVTTNGITDTAITELVKSVQDTDESVCVCKGREFVMENNNLVCDNCGRIIKEFKDPLQVADKKRPKGKRMIRSEAHPMNTHVPDSIGETIKKAFSNARLNEEDEEDEDFEYQNVFASLHSLYNEFWTRLEDIVSDIEDLGYEVVESNNEYIVISSTDDDDVDHQLYVPIGGTSRTLYLELDKSREDIIL